MNIEENKTNCHPELVSGSRCSIKGFTLIELLVVVLIIGILSAIAVPQYQKAILKSRFSSLMPTTQAIRDGNEMYYMTNGRYANDVAKLDVTTANTEDMTITLSDDDDYAYTLATRPNIKNNLIMYQKHSANFPGEIHCEALQTNRHANWLCEKSLHGEKISGSITSGYNTYILEGANKGLFGALSLVTSCDKALSMGYTCELMTNEDGNVTQKKVCTPSGICSIVDYTENGYKRTTCQLNSNNICETKREYTYNADGDVTSQRFCSKVNSDGSCSSYSSSSAYDYKYDENGKMAMLSCSKVEADGICSKYTGRYEYVYDKNGNKMTGRLCATVNESDGSCIAYSTTKGAYDEFKYDYTYDENGNQLSQRLCQTIDASDGSCSVYSTSYAYDWTYDEEGQKKMTQRMCSVVESDGKCSEYNNSSARDYVYDAKDNLSIERFCKTVNASDGKCSEYSNNGVKYTYDENGNRISTRVCNKVTAAGVCQYSSSPRDIGLTLSHYDYTYDANGNLTSSKKCERVNSNGSCYRYDTGSHMEYDYDENGNQIAQRHCERTSTNGSCERFTASTSSKEWTYDGSGNVLSEARCYSVDAAGRCSKYSEAKIYLYNDDGNQIGAQTCRTWNDTRTECAEWNAAVVAGFY